ncbi:pentapeptide repeat-containing protein [Enterocloster aldenensis]|uniref:pentapeptide repeat-containing protein n=1 Tax=Enterocloster aldenensis TaxID=358742 RepID=UPI0025A44FD4|nr:pentapeptide repeat-containing protein [Enterocloster aldenensis]
MAGEYRGKVLHSDADRVLTEMVYSVNRRLAEGVRPYLWDFDMRDQVKTVHKENPFLVKWGGHWEESATVFVGDTRMKSQELFEEVNQKNDIEKMDTAYVYGNWDEILFNGLKLGGKALLYQSFRNTIFEQCQLTGSTFYGSNLRNAHMRKTVFWGCNLSGCNFKDSALEDVLFSGCDLTHSVFTGSELNNVSFERSIMEGAEFSRECVPFLRLEPAQFQQIKIQAEE